MGFVEMLYPPLVFPLILMAVREGYCSSAAGSYVRVFPVRLQLLSSGLSWLEELFGRKVGLCGWS